MLPAVERHLKLRNDVDVRGRAGGKIAIAHDFEHRRPQSAETILLPEAAPGRSAPEQRARRFVGGRRLIGTDLELHERGGRQDLTDAGKQAECRDPAAEPPRGVAAREHDFTLTADDRRRAREEHALPADGDVAETARARALFVVDAAERNGDLQLITRGQPMFVAELAVEVGRVPPGEAHREHRLALGKRLLGAERPRQVQLTARIGAVAALPSQVGDHRVDLLGRELVAEGRHDPREAAAPAAVRDGRLPVDVELGRGTGAVGEIRKRRRLVESDGRVGSPFAVRPVATGAAGLEDRLARGERARHGLRACGRRGSQRQDKNRCTCDECATQVWMYDTRLAAGAILRLSLSFDLAGAAVTTRARRTRRTIVYKTILRASSYLRVFVVPSRAFEVDVAALDVDAGQPHAHAIADVESVLAAHHAP